MTDNPKKPWFHKITDDVMQRLGTGGNVSIEGDGARRIPLQSASPGACATDVYGQIKKDKGV